MQPLKMRSMVGLIPLFAVETLEPELLERCRSSNGGSNGSHHRPELASLVSRWTERGADNGGCSRCCADTA